MNLRVNVPVPKNTRLVMPSPVNSATVFIQVGKIINVGLNITKTISIACSVFAALKNTNDTKTVIIVNSQPNKKGSLGNLNMFHK